MSPLEEPDPTVTGVLPVVSELPADAEADEHAAVAGLTYVTDDDPGIRRVRRGTGFSYHRPDGTTISRDSAERGRMDQLAIPPAWEDVWICPDPSGHIQATGRDEAGRKQYRYHPRWRAVRDATKFHRMAAFGDALPAIRARLDRDLRRRTLSRERVLALVVALLDETLLRIGSDRYVSENGAYGLTTLLCEHVDITSRRARFAFPGKAGSDIEVELRDRRLAGQLLRCEEVPGQRLFAFRESGHWRDVTSDEVNDYIREAADDDLTAKDFRTWGATALASAALRDAGEPEDRRAAEAAILRAIDVAAERLGNTREVARSSYVDPRVPKAYRFGRFAEAWDEDEGERGGLRAEERAVRRILDLDLPSSRDLERQLEVSLQHVGG
jgi:DNA topoisomerase I